MKVTKTVFNLIEIFTKAKRRVSTIINPIEHCEKESIHDFYCETAQSK